MTDNFLAKIFTKIHCYHDYIYFFKFYDVLFILQWLKSHVMILIYLYFKALAIIVLLMGPFCLEYWLFQLNQYVLHCRMKTIIFKYKFIWQTFLWITPNFNFEKVSLQKLVLLF